jgi:DNA mismatch repair protein MutS
LADPKRLLTDIYFELQEIFESKYGENVLMFIELGSFFEIYSETV